MGAIKKFMEDVEERTIIDWESIQPADDEGYEMDAIAHYDNKEYRVELRANSELTYEEQAARQITDALLHEPATHQEDGMQPVIIDHQPDFV